MTRRIFLAGIATITLSCMILLSACGQSGKLYLPEKSTSAVNSSTPDHTS